MIKYTNRYGHPITEQQVNVLDEYDIKTVNDVTGKTKIVERIRKNRQVIHKWLNYYLDSDENKDIVIQQLSNTLSSKGFTIYFNQQSSNGFDMWDCEDYNNEGILQHKSKMVVDSSERKIFDCSFDLQTNEIKSFPYPTKYYYGNNSQLEGLVLRFTYELDENNNYQVRIKDVYETTGEIHTMSQDEFIEFFGINFWNAHPYYHSIEPYLPTTPNI